MNTTKKILKWVLYVLFAIIAIFFLLSWRSIPAKISYGVTFSAPYTKYLGLDPREVFVAILDDFKVKKLRLAAYWTAIEPQKGIFDFSETDFEVKAAQKRNAEVILVVGRRLPRWPECHVPDWAKNMSWEEEKKEILIYVEKTVERYKSYPNIKYWQVENEPFLTEFAKENCGDLDKNFLKEEIDLVKKIDPTRPVLVTDSGNLGLWYGAWRAGDVFGTSIYIYLWNPDIGQIKSILPPSFYRAKTTLMSLLFGSKKSILVELSLEPWLLEPIDKEPIETQTDRMSLDKFAEVVNFAKNTGFGEQYLWGAEWWYWIKQKGHPEYWQNAKKLFLQS